MAWFLNFYRCERCAQAWSDEWSCMCDDECPHCGARDMSPSRSEDLTELILGNEDCFVVLRSADDAEDEPSYEELGRFSSRAKAEEFLATSDPN
ncbi:MULTISPECIES: hypothetical protein [unclassified Bradyrhizobium]|uniref:hypothetical protein n=1 Tax=unclassified Bradyrhizobium TaxID=2631580 RepID=UPI00291692FE|nr:MULTISPECIES: hypothetical protein [unclassified Bradyrhizobium]